MNVAARSAVDPTAEFFAAIEALDGALAASDWPAAGESAGRLEAAVMTCSAARIRLDPEAVAKARALADRCAERVEKARVAAVNELASLGTAGRAIGHYGR